MQMTDVVIKYCVIFLKIHFDYQCGYFLLSAYKVLFGRYSPFFLIFLESNLNTIFRI